VYDLFIIYDYFLMNILLDRRQNIIYMSIIIKRIARISIDRSSLPV